MCVRKSLNKPVGLFPAFYNKYNDFFDFIKKYFEKKRNFPTNQFLTTIMSFTMDGRNLMFIKFL